MQIVVTSSVAGKLGGPIQSSYSASKFALHGYFDALRSEIAQFNIGVLLVCAGPVESEIVTHAMKTPDAKPASEGKKMPTARCTGLIVRAMYNKGLIQEIWISTQPILLLTYLNVYLPWVTRQLFTKAIGPSRRRALINGESVYDFMVRSSCRRFILTRCSDYQSRRCSASANANDPMSVTGSACN